MQTGSDDGAAAKPVDTRIRNRNRLLLVGLIALSLLPLAAAVAIYFGASWMVAGAQTNRGWLIDPPGDLEALGLVAEDGALLVPGERRRWRLLVVTGADCDESCIEALELLRQVHILLGRDSDRLLRFAVITPASPPGLRGTVRARLPEMNIVDGPPDLLEEALADRNLRGQQPIPAADAVGSGILTVDPLGNVVLYHGLDQIGPDLLSDLKQLLRLSNIG
ncbi:MAG: hypothetical protein JJT88_17475 [Gammaproteobacteria bacterium]|nr:hypothetical protein [Gammaproteobacteria bacterium]